MRAKPSREVWDHFCASCGGYLGTTRRREEGSSSEFFAQQDRLYFAGLGRFRGAPHLKGCPALLGDSMRITVSGRLEHELPDSVSREDLVLAYR